MRRALSKEWPSLSTFYPGLFPWHAGGPQELTFAELDEYRRQMRQAQRKQQKAKPTRRGR